MSDASCVGWRINVLVPLIPAFIASGLITGIINILKRPDIVGDVAVHYPNLLGLMGIGIW